MSTYESFISHFTDFNRTNQFITRWSGPGPSGYEEHLSMACKSIEVPGITFTDGIYDGRKFAVGYDYDSFTATFYIDSDGSTLACFDQWSNKIFDKETVEFGFKTDYESTVNVDFLSREGDTITTIQILKAFPVNISPISMAWDGEGEVSELSVSFDFDYYRTI